MQDARNEWGRSMQEAEVCFQVVIVGGWGGYGGPEDRVVVGEEGEDDSQEEASRCLELVLRFRWPLGGTWGDLRTYGRQ